MLTGSGCSSQGRAVRGAARLAIAVALVLGGVIRAPAGSGTFTGLCPDGSLFVVHQREAIPCSGAKLVEPSEVPPLRPELLPRPYTWEVYTEGADPNNPYNLIDAAREVRALRNGATPPPPGSAEALAPPPTATVEPASAGAAGATAAAAPLALGEDEIRDLFLIVELSQQSAPAEFVKEAADGSEAIAVALGHSAAFEERLRSTHSNGSLGAGPILLFSVVSQRAEAFHGSLTFTQGHLAFSPDPANALQLGLLQGRLGELEAGEVVLGWVALPETLDLRRPMGVYWNDRHTEVTFAP